GLRESYIRGTKSPAFDEPIEAGEASGDGLGAGRFIAARGISRPAAQPGHDPGEPGQTPLRVRVLQLFSSPFELSVERRQRRLVCRVRRVGQDLAGLAVPSNHDLHDPLTICMIRTAAISATTASFTNLRASVTCDSSACIAADFSVRNTCSMVHLRRYQRTISFASPTVVTTWAVSSRQCSVSTQGGASTSVTSTTNTSTLAASLLSAVAGRRNDTLPKRSASHASRSRRPASAGNTIVSRYCSGHASIVANSRP